MKSIWNERAVMNGEHIISRISNDVFVLNGENVVFRIGDKEPQFVEENEKEYERYIKRFCKLYKKEEYELPLELTIVLSDICNLRCVYCYSDAGRRGRKTCNLDAIKLAVESVINNRLIIADRKPNAMIPKVKIRFTGGGEPTCSWNELVKIVDYIHERYSFMRHNIMIVLQTNGQLSDEQIDYICGNFDEVIISCDGVTKIQDEQRPRLDGKSSWGFVKHLLERLREVDLYCYIRATVTSRNIDHLEEFCRYMLDNYSYIKHINISPVEYVGRAMEQDDLSISKEEYSCVANELKEKFVDMIRCSLFDAMYSHANFCDAYKGKHLIVTSSGNLVKCFLEAANSNIDENYINYYYREGNFVKNEQSSLVVIPDSCLKCIAYYSCYGGCPRLYPRNKDGFLTEAGRDWCQSQKDAFVRGAVAAIEGDNAINISRNRYGVERIVFLGR